MRKNNYNSMAQRYVQAMSQMQLGPQYPQDLTVSNTKRKNEFIQIIQRSDGLYAIDIHNRKFFLSDMVIHSVTLVHPDPLYRKSDFYQIKVNNSSALLTVTEYQNGKALISKLIEASGSDFQKVGSDLQIRKLLKEFLSTLFTEENIGFYYGWKSTEQACEFYTVNGKTHGTIESMSLDVTPDAPLPSQEKEIRVDIKRGVAIPFENTLVQNVTSLFETISDPHKRSIILLCIHAAALYSLLKEKGAPIRIGLCLNTSSPKISICLTELFEWYEDKGIAISETPAAFLSLLTQRKDQPLLIKDSICTTQNRDKLIDCIRDDSIPIALKDCERKPSLQAFPTIIGNCQSTLCTSSELMYMEIHDDDLIQDACNIISELRKYLPLYIQYFIFFVQQHIPLLEQHLTNARTQVFNELSDDSGLSEQGLLTLCSFYGLEKIVRDYHDSVYKDSTLANRLDMLISDGWHKTLFDLLRNNPDHKTDDTSITALFSKVLAEKLTDNQFDVRYNNDPQNGAICEPGKEGIVYFLKGCVCLSGEAYSYMQKACNVRPRRLQNALNNSEFFVKSNWNNTTKLNRITLHAPNGDKIEETFYMIPLSKLGWRINKKSSAVSKSLPGFTLNLGETEAHEPIIFSGGHNNHIFLSGKTGSGKSYKLTKMISQLPDQGVRCIIFDSTGDFTSEINNNSNILPVDSVKIVNFKNSPYSILPFSAIYEKESLDFRIQRLVDCISSIVELGSKQKSTLEKVLTQYLSQEAVSPSLVGLNDVISIGKSEYSVDETVKNAIQNLCQYLPSGSELFDWELDTPGITIVQLHGNFAGRKMAVISQLLTGFIIHLRKNQPLRSFSPVVFVYDECQELDMHADTQIAFLLRQGRKYGFSGFFSTQWIAKESVKYALGDVGTRLYFTPTENDLPNVTQNLFDVASDSSRITTKSEYRRMLAQLEVGQFVYVSNKKAILSCDPMVDTAVFSLEDIIF